MTLTGPAILKMNNIAILTLVGEWSTSKFHGQGEGTQAQMVKTDAPNGKYEVAGSLSAGKKRRRGRGR